jgi:hypothetical protein
MNSENFVVRSFTHRYDTSYLPFIHIQPFHELRYVRMDITDALSIVLDPTLPITLSKPCSHVSYKAGALGKSLSCLLVFRNTNVETLLDVLRHQMILALLHLPCNAHMSTLMSCFKDSQCESFGTTMGWWTLWWVWSYFLDDLFNTDDLLNQPFTASFPHADIHELLSPDILHQVIKGSFKDHLVDWVTEYIKMTCSHTEAARILSDIDRRYVQFFLS